jgi:hypothetical protein
VITNLWQSKLRVENLDQLTMINKIGQMMFVLVVKEGNMNSSFTKFLIVGFLLKMNVNVGYI